MRKEAPFEDAASWANDREQMRERSQRRAWLLLWIVAGIAIAEAFALIALTPLKTVVPYMVLVDRQTGYVTTLDPSKAVKLSNDEALTRSLLTQYVVAREGFSIGSVKADYRKVFSWSAGPARAGYERDMSSSNPDSPLVRYPRSTTLEVTPKSVSPIGDGTTLVRFDVTRIDNDGRTYGSTPYAAVIQYHFAPRAMSVEERFFNPLGFEVTRYRRDPEAAPAPVVVAPVENFAVVGTAAPVRQVPAR